MLLDYLHFANPLWLWVGLLIPIVMCVFLFLYQKTSSYKYLETHIDSHLLPFLLAGNKETSKKKNKTLWFWSLLWLALTLAVAGPRWNFREIETFSRDQSLVIALDLSESMNAVDIRPSRLIRAKQKIEDLLNEAKDVKIGLIAFAADSHMMTPITDDKETIRHILKTLNTSLIAVQGSKLTPALEMSYNMLQAEPGTNKSLLIISDGGFEDSSALSIAKKLVSKGIVINTMGVGTVEGAPLKEQKRKGLPVMVKLEKERLVEVSKLGSGRYLEVQQDETVILSDLEKRATAQAEKGKKNQIWEERFYLLFLPCLPIMLWWFRRGALFAVIIFFSCTPLEASLDPSYFKNQEEQAAAQFAEGNYQIAAEHFQDLYRKGVALYKAGNFKEAEKCFSASKRPEVALESAYNKANSLVFQNKLKEAITAYEDVLQEWADHKKSQDNLAVVRQMLDEQKQNKSDSDNKDKQNEEKNNDSKDEKSQDKQSDNKEPEKEDPQNQDNNEKDQEPEKPEDKESPAENKPEPEESKDPLQELAEAEEKSQEEQDADNWLNQLTNDQETFLKNKFLIESKKNGTKGGVDPW